ncbi:MAG: GDSL-type esterase/lipase family protein [Bacteroidales bacterium]|nr:GDSL-type esterase/lipase family protein [Bacteroidales bacterium]
MRRSVLTYILLLSAVLLSAQPPLKTVPDLDFARFSLNHIAFDGDSSAFGKLFSKMDTLFLEGKGKVSVLHMGGSHVQGGTMTRALRNDLLSVGTEFGVLGDLDGGRGLVFPFSAAKTNNPSSFKTRVEGEWTSAKSVQREPSSRLGLSGMAVSTSDTTASLRIVLVPRHQGPEDVHMSFSSVRVLGWSAGGGMEPVVVSDCGDTLAGVPADSSWLFSLPCLQDSVKIAFRGGKGPFTLTGVYLDRDEPGITVSGVGVNGASLVAYSRCQDLERDLALVHPDLAVLAIGINDAMPVDFSGEAFKARYRALIARIRSVNPDCALLFVTNNDSFRRSRKRGYYVNANGEKARAAFKELCAECGGGVWDQYEIMGGTGSMRKWELAGMARRDKIHFTDEGYTILGDLLYDALMEKYNEHLNRTGR